MSSGSSGGTRTAMPSGDETPVDKKLWICYILAFPPWGLFGAHNYYLGRRKMGIIYSCTIGLVGLGLIIDLIRMHKLVHRSNKNRQEGNIDPLYVDDAYMAWFPLGLIGVHRFYLGDWVIGIVFFLTLGAFSFGWWFDACFLSKLVELTQRERDAERARQRGQLNAAYNNEDNSPPPSYNSIFGRVAERLRQTSNTRGPDTPYPHTQNGTNSTELSSNSNPSHSHTVPQQLNGRTNASYLSDNDTSPSYLDISPPEYSSLDDIPKELELSPAPPTYDSLCVEQGELHM